MPLCHKRQQYHERPGAFYRSGSDRSRKAIHNFLGLRNHVWITTVRSEPGSGDATALISNARSFPSSSTTVGQIDGRMLDPAGWSMVTMAVKVWFTVSTEITFTCSSSARPNSRNTNSPATTPLVDPPYEAPP